MDDGGLSDALREADDREAVARAAREREAEKQAAELRAKRVAGEPLLARVAAAGKAFIAEARRRGIEEPGAATRFDGLRHVEYGRFWSLGMTGANAGAIGVKSNGDPYIIRNVDGRPEWHPLAPEDLTAELAEEAVARMAELLATGEEPKR